MTLKEWNRNRHLTFKDNREAEIPYIPKVGAVPASSSTTTEPRSEPTKARTLRVLPVPLGGRWHTHPDKGCPPGKGVEDVQLDLQPARL